MRILCFSDWRVQEIEAIFDFIKYYKTKSGKNIDLIVYAGDDIERFETNSINYFSELAKLTTKGKILAVIGNDDTLELKKVLKGE